MVMISYNIPIKLDKLQIVLKNFRKCRRLQLKCEEKVNSNEELITYVKAESSSSQDTLKEIR